MRIAMAGLLLCMTALPGLAQETGRPEAVRRLDSTRISVDFRNIPLSGALDYLREATKINFVLRADATSRVDLRLRDVSARSVLNLMLTPLELTFAYRNGAIVIAPPGRIPNRVRLQIYDVKDLAYGIRDFPGISITLDSGAGVVIG